MELQLKDKKILQQLLIDGREKVSVIAHRSRLSHEIVDYRLQKLQRENIIRKFGVFIDETKLGYHLAQILLNIIIESKEEERRIIDILRSSNFTVWVVKCGGIFNFGLELFAKDIHHLDAIINEFAHKLGKRLVSYESFIVSYQYKYTYGVGSLATGMKATGAAHEAMYSSSPLHLSEKELHLLSLLEANGRATLVELSKKLKSSPDTVSYYLKKMREQGVLLGIIPQLDLAKLGFQQYIVIITLKDVEMIRNPLKAYIQQHPYIRYCVRHVGKMQLYTLVCAESTEHFHSILEELQYAHKGIINSMQFYPIFAYCFESLFPKGLRSDLSVFRHDS
jgi:DNA-binding Lrp family transcriptional regulator